MADTKELIHLLEVRIPDARNALKESHNNLEGLASYCEQNYVESGQTTQFLEDTKQYAAQSLASVAYQVNVLATGMLELLDKQMRHMNDMESHVRHISQAVDIHKEKVARREIGQLASSKNITRTQKVVTPAQKEKPHRYVRMKLDFTNLDHIGHGIRSSANDLPRKFSNVSAEVRESIIIHSWTHHLSYYSLL
jgi:abl interactor 2